MKHLQHTSETAKHLHSIYPKYLQNTLKHFESYCKTFATSRQNICNICVKHIKHPDNTCNVRLKKQMKHLEEMFATYVYSHCNIFNILIYFCNIQIKHLQHTSETLETYVCNMCF
jgi:hypothetical protein